MKQHFNRHIAILLIVMMTALFIPVASFASDEADTIEITVDSGEELVFDEGDFNDACEDLTGETLDYVNFDPPSSSKGILYYDYDGSDQDEVDDSDEYYYDEDDGDSIGDVSFVADDDYDGTVTISYTGYDADGNDFTGEIEITVSDDTADDVEYSVDAGDAVEFDEGDLYNACYDLNDADLDYVNFTLPSSSKGILYYDYDGDDEEKVSKSTEYYYDEDDGDAIEDVSFVADDDYDGTVTIGYTGYDTDGNDFSGEIVINVSGDSSDSDGDITYSTDQGDEVSFDGGDFSSYCEDENDASLNYATFDLPSSSKGVLYYDYDGDDEYEIDDSDKFYYDEDDGDAIDDITFVPDDDYTGDCEIDFSGYDEDGDSIEGTVVVSVGSEDAGSAGTIYLSGTAGSGIPLIASFFNTKCEDLTDNSLSYVKFTLPSSSVGTLYYGYASAGSYTADVTASTKYYYSQAYYLKNVSFVPASTDAGTAAITYTGYATDGTSYTGQVYITYSASSGSSTVSTAATLAANATAVPTSSKVVVNGTTISFDAYNINGSNYFKLRDLAYAVNGSAKQFGVAYDSTKKAISLVSNSAYVAVGGELAGGNGAANSATLTTSPIYKDGALVSLGAYNINGNNYFKLRDLAKAFNIGVSWNASENTVEINAAASYTE